MIHTKHKKIMLEEELKISIAQKSYNGNIVRKTYPISSVHVEPSQNIINRPNINGVVSGQDMIRLLNITGSDYTNPVEYFGALFIGISEISQKLGYIQIPKDQKKVIDYLNGINHDC